ncbi:MAG: RHS repeat protein [Planctomycetes bacterium]|nr:RHS repeat protein [Planctomycetota bacterium]
MSTGRTTKTTDARGKHTTYACDKNGNQTLVTDPLSNSTTSYFSYCGGGGGCSGPPVFNCSLTTRTAPLQQHTSRLH